MGKWIKDYLNRSIANRMVAICFTFVLPIVALAAGLFHIQKKESDFIDAEINGIAIIRDALVIHKQLNNGIINDNTNNRLYAAKIEEMGKYKHSLKPQSRTELNGLYNNYHKYPDNPRILLSDTSRFIRTVADEYNLVLDQKITTYSLINIGISRFLPITREYMHLYDASKKGFDNNINIESRGFQIVLTQFKDAKKRATKYNKNGALNNELETLDKYLEDALINPQTITQQKATATVNYIYSVQDDILILIEHQLKIKKNNLMFHQFIILGGSILLVIIGFNAILFVLRDGVVGPIKRLTRTMSIVADGNYRADISDDCKIDEIGEMNRALKILRDNSLARIEAENASKAKSEFLAVMSHEIRTPMNGVIGMAQAMENTKLDAAQKEMLDIVKDSAISMVTLLDDILDISKIEAGKIEIEHIRMSPCAIIRGAAQLFEVRAHEKNLIIETKLDPSVQGWYFGDPNRLRQIIYNLVSNAIKFTDAGKITISMKRFNRNSLQISVTDTGIGIPEDKIPFLFDKFTQADSSTTRVYGGTGLGLSICSGIVNLMNGKIWVESELNVGSVFSFSFEAKPVDKQSTGCLECSSCINQKCVSSQMPPSETGKAIMDNGNLYLKPDKNLTILVAEDNATNILVLQTLFSTIDIEIDVAENGKEAYEMWLKKHYDLILMDIHMPVWDGYQAMKEIRTHEATYRRPHTPIIALSANVMPEDIEQQIAFGADTTSPKPINFEKLQKTISELLDKENNKQYQGEYRNIA